MSFSYKCKHCGAIIQAEDSWVGKMTSCPQCSQMVTIPPPIGLQPSPVYASASCSTATAALVCGILSFIGLPFCGLIAFILGIIALGKINNSNGLLTGKGKAIAGIIFGILAFFRFIFLAAILLPAMSQAREKARTISCASNLKQIGFGILLFTDDNNDKYPKADECKNQIMEYVGDKKCFHCPSSTYSDDSYRFFVNGKKRTDMMNPSTTIMAVCTSTHHNRKTNVLFADGHVEIGEKAEVDAAIQNAAPGTMPVMK